MMGCVYGYNNWYFIVLHFYLKSERWRVEKSTRGMLHASIFKVMRNSQVILLEPSQLYKTNLFKKKSFLNLKEELTSQQDTEILMQDLKNKLVSCFQNGG